MSYLEFHRWVLAAVLAMARIGGAFAICPALADSMIPGVARRAAIFGFSFLAIPFIHAGMPPGEYEVCGAHARLEPNGLLWNPARNCLVGATTPMAAMMRLLRDRIGLSDAELEAIGRDNPLRLIRAG